MSAKLRQFACAVMIALLGCPAESFAAQKPLGVVLQAQNATLRASDVLAGTTIFTGDTISTGHSGRALVRMGASQIEVMPDSMVNFEEIEAIGGATLLQGAVGFASPENGTLAVRAAGIVIRPQAPQLTHGQVTLSGPLELLVTSYRGPLELTLGDESLVVPQGTTYRVVQGDSRGPGPVGAGAEAARLAPFKAVLVAAAVVAVPLVTVIAVNLLASPSSVF